MMVLSWLVPATLVCIVLAYACFTRPIRRLDPAQEWLLEGAAPLVAPVPRKVWSYWHDDHPPLVVRLCIDNWKALNPGYEVRLLSARSVADFLPDVPPTLSRLGAAKQSDWIRLALLERYGGIWLDSSIILTTSLDWMLHRQQATAAEYVGFYLDRYAVAGSRPLVDSWCMAAPVGSPFIRDWLALFRAEVIDGETEDYLDALRAGGRFDAVVQKLGSPSYHTVHVCAQDLLERHPSSYRLLLLRAEDSAYAFQARSRWKRRRLYVHLLFNAIPDPCTPMIKLRGGERRKLEPYVRLKLFRRRSIVGRFLFRISPETA